MMRITLFCVYSVILFLPVVNARRFRNIASNPERSGLHYRRAPSKTRPAYLDRLTASLTEPIPLRDIVQFPWGTQGQPGVAVGDFNADGFDDIYVTNGPGAVNSLFINQFPKKGRLVFEDMAATAGVAATEQDSTGVCYGDLNGDGHVDLVVLSEFDSNKIFLSNGDSTFRELPWELATGDISNYPSASCAIGDVNNDGKLDLVIANGVPRDSLLACVVVPFDLSQPNQLFINAGKSATSELSFKDTSFSSGINDYGGSIPPGKFTLTWAATLIDIDMDGNLDLIIGDDQCGFRSAEDDPVNGVNRGSIRIQSGDGTGKFVSRTLLPVNAAKNGRSVAAGSWMGLGFGDFNCDGRMDLFGSNFGSYHAAKAEILAGLDPPLVGHDTSRWFLGDDSPQGFTDASVREAGVTPFGWGNAVLDYDNDGDQDIVMVGSLDEPRYAGSDNPNLIYTNLGCRAKFRYDLESLEPTGTLRNYQGLAIGDFNQDGYPDVVAASGYRSKPDQLSRVINYSHPLDRTAYFTDVLALNPDRKFVWNGNLLEDGDMMVQINRKRNRRRCWATVQPVGMQGILSNGMFNRGGLGATIIMKPRGMRAVMTPIVSGESFGSQHSPSRNFGLGRRCRGTVDIVWPQGIRNRLYNVRNKQRVIFPEVPCSFTGRWRKEYLYRKCVDKAIRRLVRKEIVSARFGDMLNKSMMRARREYLNSER